MIGKIDSLPVLILYPHARCNCRCVMCDIWKGTSAAELTAEALESHIEDIERLSVRWVVFSGGEPLMHSDLYRLSELLRARNIRVSILSTGLLLRRNASKIIRHIDDVIVSLDGPEQVHDRIRRTAGAFSALREGASAIHRLDPAFPISARCTVQRANFAYLCETAREARQLGLTSISYLAADLTSEAFNRPSPWSEARQTAVALRPEDILHLESEMRQLSSEWAGTGFVLESRYKLDRIIRHFRAHLELCEPEAPRCNAPWVSAVIDAEGFVRPCFFHPVIGSLKTHTLYQVLNGFEAQQFRSSLRVESNPICRRCVCSLNVIPGETHRWAESGYKRSQDTYVPHETFTEP
jgi:MoaA/NifB/PqqE/SkfB family radical SAM enzyme